MRRRILLLGVLILSGLALAIGLHTLRAGKSRRLSVHVEQIARPIQRWLLASPKADAPYALAEREGKVVLRTRDGAWRELYRPPGPVLFAAASALSGSFLVASVARPATPDDPGSLDVRSFCTDGAPVAQWSIEWAYDRPVPGMLPLHRGTMLVLGWSDLAVLQVLRLPGKIREVRLFDPPEYAYTRALYLAEAPHEGEFFALTTRRPASPPLEDSPGESGEPWLFRLNSEGELIESQRLEADDLSGLASLPDHSLLILGLTDLPAPGEVRPAVLVRDLARARDLRVSSLTPDFVSLAPSGRYLYLADPLRAAALRLRDGRVVWRFSPHTPHRSILQIAALPGTDLCAVLTGAPQFEHGRFVYRENRVLLVDKEGKTIDSADLPVDLPRRPLLAPGPGYLDVLTTRHRLRIAIGE